MTQDTSESMPGSISETGNYITVACGNFVTAKKGVFFINIFDD